MRISKYIMLICVIVIGDYIWSQSINFSGNLITRFGRGFQFDEAENRSEFDYDEVLLNTNIHWINISAWIQYEFSDPPEYGRSLNTIRRFRFNYTNENWSVDVGDIYRSWDRGMVLSQFDDQQINFDNSIRGVGATYTNSVASVDLIGGYREVFQSTPFNTNLRKHDESIDHVLYAARLGSHMNNFSPSLSILIDDLKFPIYSGRGQDISSYANAQQVIAGLSFEHYKQSWDVFFDMIYKNTILDTNLVVVETNYTDFTSDTTSRKETNGYAVYTNINKYLNNWTITFEYKKYHYAVHNPNVREVYPYPEGATIFQNPPLAFYEHSSTLLNRNIHQLDKSDEIGYNIAVNGNLNENTNLYVSHNRGSRNASWSREPGINNYILNPWEKLKSAGIIPLKSKAADPYKEYFAEVNSYLFNDKLFIKGGLSQSDQVLLLLENINTDVYDSLSYEFKNTFTIPIELSYTFPKNISLELKYQWQRSEKGIITNVKNGDANYSNQTSFYFDEINDEFDDKQYQYSQIFQAGLHWAPKLGISFIAEIDKYYEGGVSSKNIDVNFLEEFWESIGLDTDKTWLAMEVFWNISSKYRLDLFYGSEKGGLQCRNGVCKIIQPFSDGFRLSFLALL